MGQIDRARRLRAGAIAGAEMGVLSALIGVPAAWLRGPRPRGSDERFPLWILFVVAAFAVFAGALFGAIIAVLPARTKGRAWIPNGLAGIPVGLSLMVLVYFLDPEVPGWLIPWGGVAGFIGGAAGGDPVRPRVAERLARERTRAARRS